MRFGEAELFYHLNVRSPYVVPRYLRHEEGFELEGPIEQEYVTSTARRCTGSRRRSLSCSARARSRRSDST